MKLTDNQKIRRDCLPKFFQEKFDRTNSLIHFIDPDYELFCMDEAVKIALTGKRTLWGRTRIEIIEEFGLSQKHSTDTMLRSIMLSNEYLEHLDATNNLERT